MGNIIKCIVNKYGLGPDQKNLILENKILRRLLEESVERNKELMYTGFSLSYNDVLGC